MKFFFTSIIFSILLIVGCDNKSEAEKSLTKTIEAHKLHSVKYPASITIVNVLNERYKENKSNWIIPKIYNVSYDWQMNERIIYISWSGYKSSNVYINLEIETDKKLNLEINDIKPTQLYWHSSATNGEWLWQGKFAVKGLNEADVIKKIDILNENM